MDPLVHLIHHTSPLFIYMIVAVLLLLESCGIPIVNSSLLLLTGALASLGQLDIFVLVFVSIVGSVSGACLAYLIGWRGGGQLVHRAASRLPIDMQKLQSMEGWFQKSGARMIFMARIIPYIRPFACFFAGISRMSFRRFFAVALSGSIIWCVGMLTAGWILGRRWVLALAFMQMYTVPTVVIIVLIVITCLIVRGKMKRRLQARLQAAMDSEMNVEDQNDRDMLEV